MRRLLAAAAVVAVAGIGPLTGVGAAVDPHGPAPAISVSGPADGATVTKISVSGTATMPGALDTTSAVRITVTSPKSAVKVCDSCQQPVDATRTDKVSFSFSPAFSPAESYNGPYDVTVSADGVTVVDLDGPATATVTRTVHLAVPPATPRSVKAHVDANRVVTVSWAKNTEPDLIGYQVQRRDPGKSNYAPVSDPIAPGVTSWSQPAPEAGGAFSYAVFAVRPGGSGEPMASGAAVTGINLDPLPGASTPTGGTGGTGGAAGAPVVQPGTGSGAPVAVPGSGGPTLDLKAFVPGGPGVPGSSAPSVALPAVDTSPVNPNLPYKKGQDGLDQGASTADNGFLSGTPLGSNQRAVVLPFAAGLLLCVAAFHVRLLNRRLA